MIVAVLTREGYEVDEAFSGQQALEEIAWDGYQAIVLDLMMPFISGFDVLRAISNARPDSRCVVVMSAASQTNLDEVNSPLVRAKLRKPFDVAELIEAVRSCTGG